jgi:hypothetical protein
VKRFNQIALVLSIIASLLVLPPIEIAEAVSANPAPVCSGANCTITFTHTGEYYTWTVPSGVTSITTDVRGAQGGGQPNGTQRGKGGRVQATLSVTPGATLYIYVGGSGTNSAGGSVLAAGGWNGGGTGGNYSTSGGGGGGASDIRVNGTALTDRKIVAGGAGGFGFNGPYTAGGHGGGLKAQWAGSASSTGCVTSTEASFLNDGDACETPGTSVNFGRGGSQTSGGDTPSTGDKGFPGALGIGGNGGTGSSPCNGPCPGGGGGGGYYGGGGGGAGPGGGGSSYTDPLTVSSVTHSRGFNSSAGSILITYLNSPSPSTFSTTQTSPTNISTGTTVSYSLVLTQSVSDLATGDFQFGGTSTCNTPGLSGSSTTYTVTVTNCSEGSLILQLKANSITGTSPGPPSVSSANTVIIDRTAPTISTVTAPANKTYIPSETPTFTVAFSESVTVTGLPRLTLTVGSTTEYATFLSMTDSRTALFRYTVASDPVEFDTDGITLATSLDLNSGTIRDLATNALTNTALTAPTLTSVLIAQPPAAPTIDSITATSGTLTVYFTPGATRGSAITNYTYATNGTTFKARADGTTASPLVITTVSTGATNLANGTGYQIRLRAVSAAGTSDSSTVVNETPTAVAVTGDATLILTYGSSASTSSYSATGGTNTYTWSLGSVISGITLSGTVVTAANTLAAGTYSQTVRATDGNSQVGTRSLTITVNKASTSISIALPNSATSAALGGAITITATVSRAGSVNFQLGGSTISGCGSASAASTSATCSWTPGALGSVSLTAIFTPTDTSNFETSTMTTLSITVVNGVSTVTLSLAGGVTTAPKGQAINIIAAVDQAGRVTFLIDGKRVPGCINRLASIGNISCSWRPAVQKAVVITANLNPTSNVYNNSSSRLSVQVVRRSGSR